MDALTASQMSETTVCLRDSGIFYYPFNTNLLLSLWVKEFDNRPVFGKVTCKNIVALFSGHGGWLQRNGRRTEG